MSLSKHGQVAELVECNGFESRRTGLPYRGFESLPVRHFQMTLLSGPYGSDVLTNTILPLLFQSIV